MTNLCFARSLKKRDTTILAAHIFFDRNPAGKDLDFDSNPDQKEPFMRYTVSFQLKSRTKDHSRITLPTLSDISRCIVLEMDQLHRYRTPARKALDKLLRSTDSYHD